jgi:hypothetical protein
MMDFRSRGWAGIFVHSSCQETNNKSRLFVMMPLYPWQLKGEGTGLCVTCVGRSNVEHNGEVNWLYLHT